MSVSLIPVWFLAAIHVYLVFVAWVATLFDVGSRWYQRLTCIVVAPIIPLISPLFVLYLTNPAVPDIAKWVPWPFKDLVRDKPIKRYSDEGDPPGEGVV